MLCAILASVVLKYIVQNRKSAQRQPFRKSVTPRLRYKKNVSPETPVSRTGSAYPSPEVSVHKRDRPHQITVKRTFSGDGTDIWSEFIRYFENVAELNEWESDRKRKVLFTVLRGQTETYAYGLSDSERSDWGNLTAALDFRFGHKAMKESYVAEAKLRRKKGTESFRDFGQAIEDLYRRAYPENREHVQESSMKTFMDNCSDTEDFRLAVKRTRPKTLQDAVTAAMQEECIRMTEDQSYSEMRIYQVNRLSHKVNSGDFGSYASESVCENKNVTRRCYKCHSSDHLYKMCPQRKLQENGNGNMRTESEQFKRGCTEAVGRVSVVARKRPSTDDVQCRDSCDEPQTDIATHSDFSATAEVIDTVTGSCEKVQRTPGMRIDGLVEGMPFKFKIDTCAMIIFIIGDLCDHFPPEYRSTCTGARA